MATRIGIRELRDGLTRILRRVEMGEVVEVTRDARTIAVLAPKGESRLEAMIASGEATAGSPLTRPIGRVRSATGVSASEALQADRGS